MLLTTKFMLKIVLTSIIHILGCTHHILKQFYHLTTIMIADILKDSIVNSKLQLVQDTYNKITLWHTTLGMICMYMHHVLSYHVLTFVLNASRQA